MREINAQIITEKLAEYFAEINYVLPKDVAIGLNLAKDTEANTLAKETLENLIKNKEIAQIEKIALCQDTGIAVVFLEIGQDVHINGDLNTAINKGIEQGYQELRKSVVGDPLNRINTKTNSPGIIHTEIVSGEKVTLKIMAKGGGAENKSAIKMFNPTTPINEIKQFVIDTVTKADAAACPPIIVGIGIGGNFEYCTYLAKKSLLRAIGIHNANQFYQKIEDELLEEINNLNIGPAGFGGKTTALAVNIETYPCHIASLPVAVNIQCHSSRHKEIVI